MPCQPFSTLNAVTRTERGGGPRAHKLYNVTFGETGSALSLAARILAQILIAEQVKGFGTPYVKGNPFSPLHEFEAPIRAIRRPDGSCHYSGFVALLLDCAVWIEASRVRYREKHNIRHNSIAICSEIYRLNFKHAPFKRRAYVRQTKYTTDQVRGVVRVEIPS